MGGVRHLELTEGNKEKLSQHGALSEEKARLSHVVRDAIQLVRSIGERLLWVDSLCIVQDNAQTKHTQISNMDLIYSHAICTIVNVAGTNADSPLSGVQPGSRPAMVDLKVRFKDKILIVQPPDLCHILAGSVYETRGWTFQERILSPRCIYFTPW
ncbi:heterokaryon incompatibility, partial [Aspergillus sclerotiicarbonarius CBS 121057]